MRDIRRAVIWGRDIDKATKCARACSDELGIEVTCGSIAEVMAQSDVVVTTTPSRTPLITADMLRPGMHITSMGSDADYKTELAVDVIPAATCFIADRRAQSIQQGELRRALAEGTVADPEVYSELGEIISGQATGRRSALDITVCDLTGTGIQDTAIATFAWQQAEYKNLGVVFTS